jgi:hypothetical protein
VFSPFTIALFSDHGHDLKLYAIWQFTRASRSTWMPIDSNDGFGGRVDSIDKLKYLLPSLRAELKDECMVFSMYSFLCHLWRSFCGENVKFYLLETVWCNGSKNLGFLC